MSTYHTIHNGRERARSQHTGVKGEKGVNENANDFPPGWDDERVQDVIRHYESQTEDEAIEEREAAFDQEGLTVMLVPTELVPAIRELLDRHELPGPKEKAAAD